MVFDVKIVVINLDEDTKPKCKSFILIDGILAGKKIKFKSRNSPKKNKARSVERDDIKDQKLIKKKTQKMTKDQYRNFEFEKI